MTVRLTARAAGSGDDAELGVLVAAVAEHPDGRGWSLVFTIAAPDPAFPAEEYCLTTAEGATTYGGVRSLVLADGELHLTLTRRAASELNLPRRSVITLEVDLADREAFRDGLARVLTATSVDDRPRRVALPESDPVVRGRPAVRRWRPTRRRGARVEFVVVAQRGALLHVQAVQRPDAQDVVSVGSLTRLLGVADDAHLVGLRYTCRVVPERFGETRSDYRLVRR